LKEKVEEEMEIDGRGEKCIGMVSGKEEESTFAAILKEDSGSCERGKTVFANKTKEPGTEKQLKDGIYMYVCLPGHSTGPGCATVR
jgi:hypothetical protein